MTVFKRVSAFVMAMVFAAMPLSVSYASIGETGCRHNSTKTSAKHNGTDEMKTDSSTNHKMHSSHMKSNSIPMTGSVAKMGKGECNHKGSEPCPMHRDSGCKTKMKGCSMVKCSTDTSSERAALEYGLEMLLPHPVESAFDESFIIVRPLRFTLGSFGISPLERPPSH